jgi:hypothetical protein
MKTVDRLAWAIERIQEGMGEWAHIQPPYLPGNMVSLLEAIEELSIAINDLNNQPEGGEK